MAGQSQAEVIRSSTVEIFTDRALGAGSYGAVYRAKFNGKPCAAKMPHPVLLESKSGAIAYMKQFKKECVCLCCVTHANIVQFLGMCEEKKSGQPALLMELMDQSLTDFLEHSKEPLPYFLEVDLCHDVAQAIEYLHSCRIIHRDLSSNNVLLTTDLTAKVTDFGMSKVLDEALKITSTLTLCPGSLVYMPPEALAIPPKYGEKMDCFSFGVLAIQIMCRLFPDPGPKEESVNDPRSPVGKSNIPILESERRKSHIDLIAYDHPLLGTAISCLKYYEQERPSSQELCEAIGVQKTHSHYTNSYGSRQSNEIDDKEDTASLKRQVHSLTQKLEKQADEIAQLKEENKHAHQEIAALRKKVQVLESRAQSLVKDKEEMSLSIEGSGVFPERQGSLESSFSVTLQALSLSWKASKTAPRSIPRGSAAVNGKTAYFMPADSDHVYAYDAEDKTWLSPLPECPNTGSALVVIRGLLTAIGGKHITSLTTTLQSLKISEEAQQWCECFPRMPFAINNLAADSTDRTVVVVGDDTRVVVLDVEVLGWNTLDMLPHPVPCASITACKGKVYILHNSSVLSTSLSVLKSTHGRSATTKRKFFSRDRRQTQGFKRLSIDLPVTQATCVTLCGQLVAVGGKDGWEDKLCASVYMYNSATDQWAAIGNMPTARATPLVTVLGKDELMVVGGEEYGMGQRSHDTGMTTYQRVPVDVVEIAKCSTQDL